MATSESERFRTPEHDVQLGGLPITDILGSYISLLGTL